MAESIQNPTYEAIKERAARVKHTQIYQTQADSDREFLLEMIGLMEATIELITMEEAME